MASYDQTKMTELEHTTTLQESISSENRHKRRWSRGLLKLN